MTKDPAKRLGYKHGDLPEHMFYRRVDWDKLGRREVQPPYKPPIVSANIDQLYILYYSTLQCFRSLSTIHLGRQILKGYSYYPYDVCQLSVQLSNDTKSDVFEETLTM